MIDEEIAKSNGVNSSVDRHDSRIRLLPLRDPDNGTSNTMGDSVSGVIHQED